MVTILILAKITTLGLLKIKVFWNKDYDVVISDYDLANKILSRDSFHIVDAVMWPKIDNCSTSIRGVIISSIL